jgi:hypothetical protein
MNKRHKFANAIRRNVAELAGHRCSYCRSPELAGVPMVIDHIVSLSAGGNSEIENLCLACYRCNEFKGARQDGVDPLTNLRVTLFQPRLQLWTENFAWSNDGLLAIGLTACGRATVETLHLNDLRLIQARRIWMIVGLHPPLDAS